MPALSPYIFAQFSDSNGLPLAAGTLTFYAAGTTTPQTTYTSQAGDTANANPLTLDSAGRATIFLGSAPYDIILKNAAGTTISTYSSISTTGGGGGASLQTTPTLTTLRAIASGASDYVLLGGNAAVGDGGSYFYYWSGSSTASDDGVNVVRPSSNPTAGRWLLLPQNNDSTGTFTVTLTGVNATVTGTASYVRKGSIVTLSLPNLTGTSNTTACTLTGLPTALQPNTNINGIPITTVRDNSNYYHGIISLRTSTTMGLAFKSSLTADYTATFTNTGTKGLDAGGALNADHIVVTYPLVNT